MKISIHIEDATEEDVRRLFSGARLQAVYEAVTAAPAEEVVEEPEPVVKEDEPVVEGDLIEQLTATRKRAKTVTLAEGVTGKEEDAVVTPDGEIGIIVACFRGIAVVEFENGNQAKFTATDLTLYKDEEPDVLGEAEPAHTITSETLLAVARKVLAAKGAAKTQEIVIASGNGAKKVSEVAPEMYPAVYAALQAAVA